MLIYLRKNEQRGLLVGEHLTTAGVSAKLVSLWKTSSLTKHSYIQVLPELITSTYVRKLYTDLQRFLSKYQEMMNKDEQKELFKVMEVYFPR